MPLLESLWLLYIISGCRWMTGGIVCSDDDLRAIVHGHQLRWSPQSMSTSCHRGQRSSSLDTASQSQSAVFSSSVESLSQSPVFPPRPTKSVEQPAPLGDFNDSAAHHQPGSSLTASSVDTQLHRKVFTFRFIGSCCN